MNFILWIIMGGIAGWLASVVMKTNSTQRLPMDIILGIVGGVLGGLVMNFFGAPGVTGFNAYSLLVSLMGAIVLVGVSRAMFRG